MAVAGDDRFRLPGVDTSGPEQCAADFTHAGDKRDRRPSYQSRMAAFFFQLFALGTAPAGEVYRRVDTVFTIEGRRVHQSGRVISKSALAGFHPSGEFLYSNLPPPVSLRIGDAK